MFTTKVVKDAPIALEHYIPDRLLKEKRLLFIHGAGGGSWGWKNFLFYFAERGFDSWALNLRGHYLAGPVKDWGDVGLAEYLNDIERAVKIVGKNIVLIGHSMSSLPIVVYAETHQVDGLIVSHPGPPLYLQEKKGITIKRPGYKPDIGDKKIKAPVFVLGVDAERVGIISNIDICEAVADEIGAHGYALIKPGGHCYMLERNWEDFAKLIRGMLFSPQISPPIVPSSES